MDEVPGLGGPYSEDLTTVCGQGSDGGVWGFVGALVGADPHGAGVGLCELHPRELGKWLGGWTTTGREFQTRPQDERLWHI